uniref:Uncharacterized protein n=1 Tax=Arundo donax TaxID=35708 RepID=A0A0A8YF80_ARUDO
MHMNFVFDCTVGFIHLVNVLPYCTTFFERTNLPAYLKHGMRCILFIGK